MIQQSFPAHPPVKWRGAIIIIGILLLLFGLAQCFLPLRTAVQIGADEGFELAKVTLGAHGHKLYTEVWNDQPPLHTFLVTQIITHLSHTVFAARLVTTGFTVLLLISLFFLVGRLAGVGPAAITVALVLVSPGFLELSASCMLEIPSLALALAGLCLLANWRGRTAAGEVCAGALFGAAILTKLISLVWTPLAVLLICQRQMAPGEREPKPATLLPRLFTLVVSPPVWKRLLIFGCALVASVVAIDLVVERGAFLLNFQQSWQSHFAGAATREYGSAEEHKFDWLILLRNWDTTLAAVAGIGLALSRVRAIPSLLFPLAWLGWSFLVFANHTPWWAYYYIHTAIPLCWMAALGFWWLAEACLVRIGKGRARPKRRRQALPLVLVGLFSLCAVAWIAGRVSLEIAGMNALPRTYSSLVIKETELYRPYAHWLYTDDLTLSYHTDIPMPPSLAVVPLKRLWSGGMSMEGIAEEFDRYRPELVILSNPGEVVSFRSLLDSNYRLVYQDSRYQLFAVTNIIRKAQSANF